MKFLAGVVCGTLLIAPQETTTVQYETIVHRVTETEEFEPLARGEHRVDESIDWAEFDRENECLWQLLQNSGVEITLESVFAFGDYADVMGGPCELIGEDDE